MAPASIWCSLAVRRQRRGLSRGPGAAAQQRSGGQRPADTCAGAQQQPVPGPSQGPAVITKACRREHTRKVMQIHQPAQGQYNTSVEPPGDARRNGVLGGLLGSAARSLCARSERARAHRMSVSARLSLRDRAAAIEAGRTTTGSSAAPASGGALASKLGRTPRAPSTVGSARYAASAASDDGSELSAAKAEITRLKVTRRRCSLRARLGPHARQPSPAAQSNCLAHGVCPPTDAGHAGCLAAHRISCGRWTRDGKRR